ncbi:MAG: helix-hairpin-helix domain-containing protein [Chitinophagaceae bacterium]
MWKGFVREYFAFTKKERVGVYILLFLIALAYTVRLLLPYFKKKESYDSTAFRNEIAGLQISIEEADSSTDGYKRFQRKNSYSKHSNEVPAGGELFYFDPNTLSQEGWQRLGIREKTAATIRKYISKGGKFYKPADIGKIWGLNEKQVARLVPYVRIDAPTSESKSYVKNETENYKSYSSREKTIVDINSGDTSAYISLPGIGAKLAQRIINFREKLGGFHSIAQVGETFGLPDSTFQKIKTMLRLNDPVIKRIDLNIASFEELKSHPYIRYQLANVIIAYRNQHGNFKEIRELKNIMIITEEVYNKIAPYVKTE